MPAPSLPLEPSVSSTGTGLLYVRPQLVYRHRRIWGYTIRPEYAVSAAGQFQFYWLCRGQRVDFDADAFPSRLACWHRQHITAGSGATHFGFVYGGPARLKCSSGTFRLTAGMYFAVPGEFEIGGDGAGMVVSRLGLEGFFHLGGPIEERGRLRYLNGCTDSLLVAPVVYGAACLNLLHVPARTDQTAHTHPSLRIGLIVRGTGRCQTPDGPMPLTPGLVFVIPAGGRHSFHTRDSELAVVAYHPDSDFGPSDESHPMLNRTIL